MLTKRRTTCTDERRNFVQRNEQLATRLTVESKCCELQTTFDKADANSDRQNQSHSFLLFNFKVYLSFGMKFAYWNGKLIFQQTSWMKPGMEFNTRIVNSRKPVTRKFRSGYVQRMLCLNTGLPEESTCNWLTALNE